MDKEQQLEVIKYIKSPEYQNILKKYSNVFENAYNKFEAKYNTEEYLSNEATYSENALQIQKRKIFLSKIEDIKWESEWAVLLRKLLQEQADNIKSQYMNAVTNNFGISKDVAVFTEDDMCKWKMLHEKDFHIFVIWVMNPWEEMSLKDKYDIYESPEDQSV